MIRGVLVICEDHDRSLRVCLSAFGESHAGNLQELLRKALEDEEGCSVVEELLKRCRRVPATYWITCPCGCEFSQRVCKKHRLLKLGCRQAAPPAGTGLVPRQNVGRSRTDS